MPLEARTRGTNKALDSMKHFGQVLGIYLARKMRTDLQARNWSGLTEIASPRVSLSRRTPALTKRHGPKEQARQTSKRCPVCHSIIYSRRHRLCGVCGHTLPEDRLFTPSEANAVTRLLSMEKQRYRQWLAKGFAQALAILV